MRVDRDDCEATFQSGADFRGRSNAGRLGREELKAMPKGTFFTR